MYGATPEQLKYDFGHKLDELVDEAVKKGLPLTTTTQEEIKLLNKAHTEFRHRYLGTRRDRPEPRAGLPNLCEGRRLLWVAV
jgi:hypothetical protein